MFPKNPSSEADWIVTDHFDTDRAHTLVRKRRLRCISFRNVDAFAKTAISTLSNLRSLNQLEFISCTLTRTNFAELCTLPRLDCLWIEHSDIEAQSIAHLSKHPTVRRLILNDTNIRDEDLDHISTIQNLEWLWLDHTKISDAGLRYVGAARLLTDLSLRNTNVTDVGIGHLSSLTNLDMPPAKVQGTSISESALDALFTSHTAPDDPPGIVLPETEVDGALSALRAFFAAINKWHYECLREFESARLPDGNVADSVWEACRDSCRTIFDEYCVSKPRKSGRPNSIAIGGPCDYSADTSQETVTSVIATSARRLVVETKQHFLTSTRCRYVLLKKSDKWLIDSKKHWAGKWKAAAL
jgi:hypothetical protein